MRATRPAAWAAHSAFQFGERLFNADIPCLQFLTRGNPADPLIARERRNIFPRSQRRGVRG